MKNLTGGAGAGASEGWNKARELANKPREVKVKLLDADGNSPNTEMMSFKGVVFQEKTTAAGEVTLENVKPGILRGKQVKRSQ